VDVVPVLVEVVPVRRFVDRYPALDEEDIRAVAQAEHLDATCEFDPAKSDNYSAYLHQRLGWALADHVRKHLPPGGEAASRPASRASRVEATIAAREARYAAVLGVEVDEDVERVAFLRTPARGGGRTERQGAFAAGVVPARDGMSAVGFSREGGACSYSPPTLESASAIAASAASLASAIVSRAVARPSRRRPGGRVWSSPAEVASLHPAAAQEPEPHRGAVLRRVSRSARSHPRTTSGLLQSIGGGGGGGGEDPPCADGAWTDAARRSVAGLDVLVSMVGTPCTGCRVAPGDRSPGALAGTGQGDFHHPALPLRWLAVTSPRSGP
jgi:hypothetical protein